MRRAAGVEELLEVFVPEVGVHVMVVRCAEGERRRVVAEMVGERGTDVHGRPTVNEGSVSVSHCGEVLALARRASGRVGVDVERGTIEGMLPAGFSERERAVLEGMGAAERGRAAAGMWVVKEAVSKVVGLGVVVDFSQIEVEGETARAFGGEWRVRVWEVGEFVVGAVF